MNRSIRSTGSCCGRTSSSLPSVSRETASSSTETSSSYVRSSCFDWARLELIRSRLSSGHEHYQAKLGWTDQPHAQSVSLPLVGHARSGRLVQRILPDHRKFSLPIAQKNLLTDPALFGLLLQDPLFAEVFARDGQLKTVGERIKRPTYARLLETVASEGADGLYTGQVAEDIVQAVKKKGGVMEVEDLGSYSTHSRPALSIPYRNHTVFTTQAPSSGSIVLSILNTLGGFEVSKKEDVDRARHTFVEAMKFGYGQRTLLGDPRESNPTNSSWLEGLTTDCTCF